jgi:hypothetical protein
VYSTELGAARVLVCCCSKPVAAEGAPAWARGLLQQLQPQRLLLVGSMQVTHAVRALHERHDVKQHDLALFL